MPKFRYRTAAQWGRTLAHAMATEQLEDDEVYMHHTAGNAFGSLDADEAFRRINAMEQARGYACIGYDILVHRSTTTGVVTIGEGRGPWRSAATLDRNEQGEAICALGYFHPGHKLSARPHPDMIEGIARGIVWGIERGWIARDAVIRGHRDNPAHPGATACPGDYLYAELPTIRDRVRALLRVNPAPKPTPSPTPSNGDTTVIAYHEFDHDLIPAPSVADVRAGKADRWLNAVILKVGAIGDVQRRHGVPVSGEYDQATANAYVAELAAMAKINGDR